jgi:hypothetical protein
MIPQQNLDLWKRIQQFELDIPNVAFPFSKKACAGKWLDAWLCFESH